MCALPSVKKGKYSSYPLRAEYCPVFSREVSYWHKIEIHFWKTSIRLMEIVRRWLFNFSSPTSSPAWEDIFSIGTFLSALSGLILGIVIGIVKNLGH